MSLCGNFYFTKSKKKSDKNNSACLIDDSSVAQLKIEQIMKHAGLQMNFIVCRSPNTSNAYASLDRNGIRYIKYDDDFLSQLNSDTFSSGSIIILAHEIGHHLSAHTLLIDAEAYSRAYEQYCTKTSPVYNKIICEQERNKFIENGKQQELEADRFAGFISYRSNITFEKVILFYKRLKKYYGNGTQTHPAIELRINAAKEGFELARITPKDVIADIQKIRGHRSDFVVSNTDRIQRNKLLNRFDMECIGGAATLVTDSSSYSFSRATVSNNPLTKLPAKDKAFMRKYLGLGENENLDFENDSIYLKLHGAHIILSDDRRIFYAPWFAYYLNKDQFQIISFEEETEPKIIYRSIFSETHISFEFVKSLFVEIFRKGLQKEIDKYYKK